MAIIYSYPLDNTPQLADLLLGTSISEGDATKSFTIGSLVALVDAPATVGTVTSVATADSGFISITGGPITNAGVLTVSLSAGGTPNDTTFLRGDNQWGPATTSGSPNIEVFEEGVSLTTAAASFNFTGNGVTASTVGDAVTVDVPAIVNGVLSVSAGAGITIPATVGNVVVSNSGVIDIIGGNNITITSTAARVFTVTATINPGTVQSVVAGNGLVLQTAQSTITTTPTIGVQYTGSNNYILVGEDLAVITGNDVIAFNQLSSDNVKSTTISTIPMTALPLVQTYIDAGDANTIKNNTDTFVTTPVVANVITLTQAEYTAIATPDTGTLYVIAAAATAFTVTLTPVTNNIAGSAANYTITGAVQGSTSSGVSGEPYSFTTIVTPNAGYYFSTPVNGNIVSGTITATANVTQTLTGTIAAVPTPAVTATLQVVTNIQGGPANGSGFVLGGNLTGAVSTGTNPHIYSFTTTCDPADGYTFLVPPVIVQAAGTIKGSQTVITTITGTLQSV